MEYKLYAISRFNWPHSYWQDKSEEEYINWIKIRLFLFEHLTVASIRNCYEKPDKWYIMIDETKVKVTEQLEKILLNLPFEFINYRGSNIQSAIKYTISREAYPLKICTCRIDTDDIVNAGYFARLKSCLNKNIENDTVISFPSGSIYDICEDIFYYRTYLENPFLAYYEELNYPLEFKGIFQSMHTEIIKKTKHNLILNSDRPIWANVIHKVNLANNSLKKTYKFKLGSKRELKKSFGIKDNLNKVFEKL